MWTSSTAGRGADDARRRPASPAARKTSSGRSRLPPAAIVAPGVLGERRAVAGRELGQAFLDARQQRRHVRRRRRGSTSVTRAGHGHASGLRPDVDRDDAAGGEDPADVAQAGARHAPRPGPPAAGSAAPSRQVAVGERTRRQASDAAARCDRTTPERTLTAAGAAAS